MKNDFEVKLYMSERRKGLTQKQAAARAGMSERTARKYEQAGALPSALPAPPYVVNPLEPVRGRLALGGRATRT
jgi:hypothetical protein